jgi:hypothetical protein
MITQARIAELVEMEKKVPKGPWESDTYMPNSQQECSYQIIGTEGVLLFESSNCDSRCINYECDEHGTYYWDEGSMPIFDFVVALRNAAPELLALAARAERYKAGMRALKASHDDLHPVSEILFHVREGGFDGGRWQVYATGLYNVETCKTQEEAEEIAATLNAALEAT